LASTHRLLINVEGETEEVFVKQVLAPHLYQFGFAKVDPRKMGNPQKTSRGGVCGWGEARRDFLNRVMQQPDLWQTTMVDYYGMPASGNRAWPGRGNPTGLSAQEKAAYVEQCILDDLQAEITKSHLHLRELRFIPFVVMHEFEGLLFSDPVALASVIGSSASALTTIRQQFPTPEEINDSTETSPSKRLRLLVPYYNKRLGGERAAPAIGLQAIRDECPHFNEWLTRLERIPTATSS
jgi:hypothetical protein